tara:strand:+ start:520 stop:804 length:285 start_codon:yes stop_codon:yes gene_type:complete
MNREEFKLELAKRVSIQEPNGDTRSMWKHERDEIIDVCDQYMESQDDNIESQMKRMLEVIKNESEQYVGHDDMLRNSERYTLMMALNQYIKIKY